MSHLERAITDGHAKLSGEGEHARLGRRWLRPAAGRLCVMRETGFETVSCSGRGDEAQTEIGKQKTKMGQSLLTSAATRVAQVSAPAGCGSVPLPVRNRATYRGGTPLEPAAGTAALRSNDLQPVSKEALITRSRNATRPFGRAASSRHWRLYESDSMNPFSKNHKTPQNTPPTLQRATRLRQTILQEAFTGEL